MYKSHGFGRTYFNSRPSARGDCRLHNSCSRQFQFQFTPLREGRQLVKVRSCEQLISIHAPPRGATGIRRILPEKICGNFNSRPSARGDASTRTVFAINSISIHAPPRGATVILGKNAQAEPFWIFLKIKSLVGLITTNYVQRCSIIRSFLFLQDECAVCTAQQACRA